MLAAFALPLLAASAFAADTCNGYASLCDQKYSNVTFIGTHNSYAVGTAVTDNQHKDITAQLNDGVRALQVQAHKSGDSIHLCHSLCALKDGGSFESYLQEVNSWMSANPKDVVTLVIVNSDGLPASQFASVFESAGISSKAYKPPAAQLSVSDWPTLGSLIDAGTPLVTFINEKADFSQTPYLIDEFSNMWEDAYDVTDQTFGCAVNRTSGQANSQLSMINHFLDQSLGSGFVIPYIAKLNETNAATGDGSIGFHVANCLAIHGRNPNIILLDYYDTNGNAPFDVAAQLNGVSAPTQSVTPFNAATAINTATDVGTAATGINTGATADVSTQAIGGGAATRAGFSGALAAAALLALGLMV